MRTTPSHEQTCLSPCRCFWSYIYPYKAENAGCDRGKLQNESDTVYSSSNGTAGHGRCSLVGVGSLVGLGARTHSQRLALGGTGEMVPPLTLEVREGGSLRGPRPRALWTHHDHSPINHPGGMASAWRGAGRKVGASSPEFPQKLALSSEIRVWLFMWEEETEQGREPAIGLNPAGGGAHARLSSAVGRELLPGGVISLAPSSRPRGCIPGLGSGLRERFGWGRKAVPQHGGRLRQRRGGVCAVVTGQGEQGSSAA